MRHTPTHDEVGEWNNTLTSSSRHGSLLGTTVVVSLLSLFCRTLSLQSGTVRYDSTPPTYHMLALHVASGAAFTHYANCVNALAIKLSYLLLFLF